MSETRQVATQQQARELRRFLDAPAVVEQLARAMPAHLTPERVIRQTLTLAQINPGLLECSQGSILAGLMRAAELGLELNGVLGQAYLVPRWNSKLRCKEATFQVGYRGLIDLAFRSGQVRSFEVRTVYEGEHFRVALGSDARIEHMPLLEPGDEPGPAVAYYAVAHLANGGRDFEAWSRRRVEAHRLQYSPPRREGPDTSPWGTAFDEMAKKTVARALAKRLPVSVEFQKAALEDEYAEAGWDQRQAPPRLPAGGRAAEVSALLDAPQHQELLADADGGGPEPTPE